MISRKKIHTAGRLRVGYDPFRIGESEETMHKDGDSYFILRKDDARTYMAGSSICLRSIYDRMVAGISFDSQEACNYYRMIDWLKHGI